MATVTHYIYSHYDPEERERLEKETGQLISEEEDPEKAWQREASRIARRTAPAPYFVPATIPYGEWSSQNASTSKLPEALKDPLGDSVSGWYHSLTSTTATSSPSSNVPSKASSKEPEVVVAPRPKKTESRNKNNWFIMKAIQSDPSSSSVSPVPSLADMLARHPPPLPSQQKYTPPVFLEIGPSNKGFGMLQRSGWNEGEPLGPDVIRRKPSEDILPDGDMIPTVHRKGKMVDRRKDTTTTPPSRQKIVEVKMENFEDVNSESDSNELEDEESGREHKHEAAAASSPSNTDGAPENHLTNDDSSPYARKALLTPISTVLKSDRLGIGLKAKTVGPYKASQKRVTHNAAALAAHVKAAEESRRRKQLYGRGHRGFERQRRRDEEHRKALLAELKSPW
ncbi:hypothetical protein BDN70DRAFT_918360 [Pholiota conissans]|uniref:G-patch domain-containing protein n=1 Tax=Pholiota conissans TaxID=109636 RepID=A0A9P6CWY4_9AGAR|nr:hypothetical protein BDN70DRAFT_918360 [Pholiota conissans]